MSSSRIVNRAINASREIIKEYLLLKSVQDRLSYASFISHSTKTIYIETPKCGCTTIKKFLFLIENKEIPYFWQAGESTLGMALHYRKITGIPSLVDYSIEDQLRLILNSNYKIFSVSRNPYTRLFSAWKNKIRLCEPGFEKYISEIKSYAGIHETQRTPSFSEFVYWLTESQPPYLNDWHWMPQHMLIFSEWLPYDTIIPLESLKSNLTDLFSGQGLDYALLSSALDQARSNSALPTIDKNPYDSNLAKKVYSYYLKDFNLFSYDENSFEEVGDNPSIQYLYFSAVNEIIERNIAISEASKQAQHKLFPLFLNVFSIFYKAYTRLVRETITLILMPFIGKLP